MQFKLYRGVAGGKFEDVTNAAGLGERPDGTGAFVDLDGDGWEDIIFISGRVQELKNLSAGRDLTPGCPRESGHHFPREVAAVLTENFH